MDRSSEQSTSAGRNAAPAGSQGSESRGAKATEPEKASGPTEAEVEEWAERVRMRRQAWVDGPTEEEKHEWLRRERARRLARMGSDTEPWPTNGGSQGYDPRAERRRLQRRYLREIRLATEGAGVLMATWPFRILAELVAVGQEFEEETLDPARRRWIPFYDDEI
ncbi:MAG: hypothetical protein ACJ789_13340 [Thermomicrobiales bacterium]